MKAASKTFLCGEYMALLGGPSIVLLTKPEFELKVEDIDGEGIIDGIHPESPAGHYIRQNQEAFIGKHISFIDPYEGRGGFGASTAQFGLIYQFHKKDFSLEELLNQYWELTDSNDTPLPSGADLAAQMKGHGLCYWHREKGQIENHSWPFKDLSFFLVRTGIKVPTHVHLKDLNVEKDQDMYEAVEKTNSAIKNENADEFILGLEGFSQKLKEKNWVHENTLELLEKVDSRFRKGCGALGADILFIATEKDSKDSVEKQLQDLELEIVATEKDLT